MPLEEFVSKLIDLGYQITPLPPYSIAKGSKKFWIHIEKEFPDSDSAYLPLSFYKIEYKFTETLLESYGRSLKLPERWWE